MQAFIWNTQRPYSPAGQRMAAIVLLGQDQIAFADFDRQICGVVHCDERALFDNSGIADAVRLHVMHAYDHGQYFDVGLYDAAQTLNMDPDAMRKTLMGCASIGMDNFKDPASEPCDAEQDAPCAAPQLA